MTKTRALSGFRTPILIIAFNRPDQLGTLFNSIRTLNPETVYISLDGPRPNSASDNMHISKCREIIDDWAKSNKNVVKNFEATNLGCRDHVLKAITWFFNHVNEGIILEDDCIASESFFPYASELLERYRNDQRILMISGNNYGKNNYYTPYSYGFTRYISIWGWATWQNEWQAFLDFYSWMNSVRDNELDLVCSTIQSELMSKPEGQYRFDVMMKSLRGDIDSWGYILSGYALCNRLSTIVPAVNLISNIGFGESSTHTRDTRSNLSEIETHELQWPLQHAPFNVSSIKYHESYQPQLRKTAEKRTLLNRLMSKWG